MSRGATADATSGVASGASQRRRHPGRERSRRPTTYARSTESLPIPGERPRIRLATQAAQAFPEIGQTSCSSRARPSDQAGNGCPSAPGAPWSAARYSKTKGATATLTFTGTDVAWVSTRDTNRGKAKVYIDGVKQAVVDLKASAPKANVIVFSAGGLTAGQHTIQDLRQRDFGPPARRRRRFRCPRARQLVGSRPRKRRGIAGGERVF